MTIVSLIRDILMYILSWFVCVSACLLFFISSLAIFTKHFFCFLFFCILFTCSFSFVYTFVIFHFLFFLAFLSDFTSSKKEKKRNLTSHSNFSFGSISPKSTPFPPVICMTPPRPAARISCHAILFGCVDLRIERFYVHGPPVTMATTQTSGIGSLSAIWPQKFSMIAWKKERKCVNDFRNCGGLSTLSLSSGKFLNSFCSSLILRNMQGFCAYLHRKE